MTTPAAHTRKEAIVNGGNERKPIFAARKFTAQMTTMRPINEAMTGRLGGRPLEDSTSTSSDQPFFPHGKFFDTVAARVVADARPRRHANRALRRDGHFRLDDVLVPVAPARTDVAGQREIRKRRERNVMRPADTRLQHSAAPHRHAILLAQVMDTLRDGVTADTPHLDVDDFARSQKNRRARLLFGMDALVQANRRIEFFLQLHVRVQIVPSKRLLNHHQIKAFQLLQKRPILHPVSRVRVNHQLDPRKLFAQTLDLRQLFPRLNFYFDSLITRSELLLDRSCQFVKRIPNPNRNATRYFLAPPPKQFRKRHALLFGLGIPNRRFQRSLSHVVTTNLFQQVPHISRRGDFLLPNHRPQKTPHNNPRRIRCLRTVKRFFPSHAFAPTNHAVRDNFRQDDAPLLGTIRTRFERSNQLNPQFPQSDFLYAHRIFSHSVAASKASLARPQSF